MIRSTSLHDSATTPSEAVCCGDESKAEASVQSSRGASFVGVSEAAVRADADLPAQTAGQGDRVAE